MKLDYTARRGSRVMPQYRARRSSVRRRLRDRVTDAIAATLCQLMRLSGRDSMTTASMKAIDQQPLSVGVQASVRPPGRRQFRARRENKI